jgi:hypothetical protein
VGGPGRSRLSSGMKGPLLGFVGMNMVQCQRLILPSVRVTTATEQTDTYIQAYVVVVGG